MRTKKMRMPKAQARSIWRDPAHATMAAALKLMPGWDRNAAYRYLGKRYPSKKLGRKVGKK